MTNIHELALPEKKSGASSLLRKVFLTLVALMVAIPGFAQTLTVTGTVTDKTGEPLIGVTVKVDGTTNGTATDLDGNYRLNNVPAKGKITFSYVGFQPQTVEVKGQSRIDAMLSDSEQTLDDLVVVGYGTIKKNDVTGSVATVGTEKLNAKGAASVLENLQGTVPGVNISKSTGRTNGGIDIEIRGKSSINSSTKPTYVVDGVITGDIDFLNPRDIERIDVLKDASSAAIYGSRASAGVVLITTKGALGLKKEQKPSISYDGYFGWSKAAHLPNFMDADEFYNYRFYKFGRSVADIAGNSPSLTPQTNYAYTRMDGGFGQLFLQQVAADPTSPYILKQLQAEGVNYFWPDLVLRNGVQQNHYVSVNGGSKYTTYNFGIGINNDKGFYKGDEATTYSFKGSMDVRINKVISAGFNLNAAYIKNGYAEDSAISHIWYMNPFMIPYTKDGEINHYPGVYDTDGNNFSKAVNPLDLLRNSNHKRKTYRLLGNVYLKLDIIKGLSFKSTFSPSYSYYRDGNFSGYANPNEPGKTYSGGDLSSALATVTNHSNLSWIWDNMLNYNVTIADDHSINAMGLISGEQGVTENYKWVATNVLENTDWWNMGSGATVDDGTKNASSSSYSKGTLMSYALRANYAYKDRYLLTATVRWDGSSKLARGHQWKTFPSVALGWVVTEEPFMEKYRNILNNLKLRLSYGITGNNAGVSNYQSLVGIGGPVYYPFDSGYANGFYPSGIVDKNLTWETSKEFNVGLDFGFLNNRISGTIDWYIKNSQDLLFEVDLPLEAGGGKLKTNIGKVRNTGIEIGLNTVNIDTHNWNWQTSLTFSHNNNKVKEINGVSDRYVQGVTDSWFIGYPVNNVYAYQWDGIVSDRNMTVPDHQVARDHGFTPGQTVRECDYYYACYGLSEGRPIIRDVDGDGSYSNADKVISSSVPKFTGSFTSNLTYTLPKKGGAIDFSFTIYARVGGKVYAPFMNGDLFKTTDRGWGKVMVDYYIPQGALVNADGMNPDGSYINPVYQTETHYGSWPFPNNSDNGGAGSNLSPVSNWDQAKQVVSASFAKVKNISLGYTFSKDILKHIGCQEARIYFNVTNPFVFTKYLGFDPEWAGAAAKNDGPSTINFQIGASIKF